MAGLEGNKIPYFFLKYTVKKKKKKKKNAKLSKQVNTKKIKCQLSNP